MEPPPVIYFDHHATTPCDPRVVEAMRPYFSENFGNAASLHLFGRRAAEAVERARASIAALIGAKEDEIVFTSGGTESDNLALKGILEASSAKGDHIVTAVTEHKAVLETCRSLERSGRARVTYVPVDREGFVDVESLRRAITDRTVLVSVMIANNEIGVLQPVELIGQICQERGVCFHTDGAQAVGKVEVDVAEARIHAMSFTAHKMYGPKGIGALYVRRRKPRIRVIPQIDGGGHEGGMRSGTLPVPLIVGFGIAADIAAAELKAERQRVLLLRERFRQKLMDRVGGVTLNGDLSRRLPGNLNVTFQGVEGQRLLEDIPFLAASLGSACSGAAPGPSHVLQALGRTEPEIARSVRFGLGRFNTDREVDTVVEAMAEGCLRQRSQASA